MTDPHATPRSQRQNAIPTNVISYKGRKIPARIDPVARIGYIVEIMSNSFGTNEHHITLCLRDEGDNLVTQTNLASKVDSQEALKLVPSPATEALSVVNSLKAARNSRLSTSTAQHSDDNSNTIPLKLALFNLQKYVKEEEFSVEFMLRHGVEDLVDLIQRDEAGLSGNTLAYALQGIRGLLEFEAAWRDLSDAFADRLLGLVVSASQPNVLRPTTAILRKLVVTSQQTDTRSKGKGKARARERDKPETPDVRAYFGFSRVWARMQVAQTTGEGMIGCVGVCKVIVKRLEGAGDLELVAQSLGFLNACLRSAQQEESTFWPELVSIVESLNVRRYVSRLMPTCANNIVEPQILNFQSRYAAILNMKRLKPVRTGRHPEHEKMLSEIWRAGRLGDTRYEVERMGHADEDVERSQDGWRRLGLYVEEQEDDGEGPFLEVDLFRDTGELGLECLHWFAMHEESLHNLVIEQEARPVDKRCPIGQASAECVKVLCENYKISQAGHHIPSHFQFFLLHFARLHSLVLKFFLRMWVDSESRLPDFDRLSFLVRTQTRLTLTDEANKTWLHLEKDFLESDYRSIRDVQMEMLEKEDGMLTRPSVKQLREKLGIDAYGVLAEQRVGCLLQGAWFNSSSIIVPGIISSQKANAAKPLRYVKLSPNRRTLAWGDFARRPPVPPSYESLRERVDLANMTDLRLQTGCPVNTRSPNLISKLSFSIMSGPELSLLDLDAVHAAQLAEWTDGIRVLNGDGGMISKETGSYVHILAELALKVRLLDITGDGVDLPEKVSHGMPPRSVDFWFAK